MGYSEAIIQSVWEKSRGMPDKDPTEWRQDECGAWIRRAHYNSEKSDFSWKIEKVEPGGPESAENLRALHRDNANNHGPGQSRCRVTADREGIGPTAVVGEPRNKNARA